MSQGDQRKPGIRGSLNNGSAMIRAAGNRVVSVVVTRMSLSSERNELPVAADLPRIVEASRHGDVIVTAAPGSGKTTLVAPAVLDDLPHGQRLVLVQPRRLAARAVAGRLAYLRGVAIGDEVGYQVRFDHCTSPATRLTVVTTGILLRQLQDNADMPGVGAVVLDEIHERSLETDLLLGLLLRIQQTLRDDLRLILMSATADVEALVQKLAAVTVIHSAGRVYPVDIRYEATNELRRDVRDLPLRIVQQLPAALQETDGHVLVFLPGVGEILRTRDALSKLAEQRRFQLLTLYGDLSPQEQDRALADSDRRKVILATNVAETSLTIPGVTGVIDSGWARQLQVHPAVGLPKLTLQPISQASAEQRAGRAGRTAPGKCWRLWDRTSQAARPAKETPEILRGDLSGVLLQLFAFGERDLLDFPWLDLPPPDAVANAERLLHQLQAIDAQRRVTPLGQQLLRLPTQPRLARLLLAGAQLGVLRETATAAALLSERDPFRVTDQSRQGPPRERSAARSRSDLVDRVLRLQADRTDAELGHDLPMDAAAARQVRRVADQLFQLCASPRATRSEDIESSLRLALLAGFPDRLARLRPQTEDRGIMVGGRGVRLEAPSRVRSESFFLCLDLTDAPGDAKVRLASGVERAWLDALPLQVREESFYNPTREQLESRRRTYYEDLLLEETPIAVTFGAATATALATHAAQRLSRILPAEDSPAGRLRARVNWLASNCPELQCPTLHDDDVREHLHDWCVGLKSLVEVAQLDWLRLFQAALGYDRLRDLDRLAPASWTLPSGRSVALQYEMNKPPILAVRIQELFGVTETPRVAGGRLPLLLHLLGPNYRPQQVTSDLASFWQNTYPQVRKDLRRRYPKHAWPEDPLRRDDR